MKNFISTKFDRNMVLDGHKLLYHLDRVKAWLNGERIAPITMDCALSRACTYRCVYCYGILQSQANERAMSKNVIRRFLKDAAKIGVKAISFVSDGESTCSPHLYDAILYGKSLDLDMALGTNGYLLRDDQLDDILPALTYIRFNVTAAEPKRYSQIHGCKEECFYKVYKTIQKCVEIKQKKKLDVTIGLQMVLMPEFKDQIIPIANLGKKLKVDYYVIKHCSDDEVGRLNVDYSGYGTLYNLLKRAEKLSTKKYLVKVKWSKIVSRGIRTYSQCFGPPFIMQLSGSGLVAPCGMLFNDRYKRFHIGNIIDTPFRKIWKSERYWKVIRMLTSEGFDPRKDCGSLCLQDLVNQFLWKIKEGEININDLKQPNKKPIHINFI